MGNLQYYTTILYYTVILHCHCWHVYTSTPPSPCAFVLPPRAMEDRFILYTVTVIVDIVMYINTQHVQYKSISLSPTLWLW